MNIYIINFNNASFINENRTKKDIELIVYMVIKHLI